MIKKFVFLLIILMSAPAWAGPIETSFCPDIPDNISFGDSPDDIIAKMGREPNMTQNTPNNPLIIIYDIDYLEQLGGAVLSFSFKDKALHALVIAASLDISQKGESAKLLKTANTADKALSDLYGTSRTFFHTNPISKESFEIKLWELENNAILMLPPSKFSDEIHGLAIVVCPLKDNGHYDLNDY